MIKIKLNAIASKENTVKFIPDETLDKLINRSLLDYGLNPADEKILQYFCAFLDGKEIPREFWEYCSVEESAEILIAPVLKGGDFGQIFGQILVLAAVVTAAYLTAGMSNWAIAGIVGATSIGATLLVHALIPPPIPGGLGGFSSSGNSYADSQMNSIAGQSNSVKKFGNVPKVYGTYKTYPNVAAAPYTELETDVSTGQLVQYFYAVYDFGFGPAVISDIKLGDTSINSFTDWQINLVDFNKPAISEGYWDDATSNSLKYYKGEVSVDSTAAAINLNKNDAGTSPDDYQVTRSAAANPSSYTQEISLDFVCPKGLYCLGTNGDRSSRTIELEIYFSKVGANDWKAYNDPLYVSSFLSAGGTDAEFKSSKLTPAPGIIGDAYSVLIHRYVYVAYVWISATKQYALTHYFNVVYAAGTSQIIVATSEINVGDILGQGTENFGTVTSLTALASRTGFSLATIDVPLSRDIVVAQVSYYDRSGLTDTTPPWQGSLGAPIVKQNLSYGKVAITANSQSQIFATFKFKPREIAAYEVRVTRITSHSIYTFQVGDELSLYEIVTRFDAAPIVTTNRHLFLEIKIKATNQLNGTIQNLSAVCSSVLDTYDTGTSSWVKKVTDNPAWVFVDLMTGEINKRKISKDRLDLTSILEWEAFCNEIPVPPPSTTYTMKRFGTNFILDYSTTLQGVIGTVANAAQASLNMVDGKYGVLIDKKRTIPVQIFTPRNSSGFSSTRNYSDPPDAIKVVFADPNLNWQQSERVVYSDGFNAVNSVKFDSLPSFACTNHEQAWRFGRYMMAQNRLRQEQISITVDFEYLVCTLGDYVQITQDVMLVGGQPARVKTVVGTTITIDDGVTTTIGPSYGYVSRGPSGIITNTLTVIDSTTFILAGAIPGVGDLIVIGEVGSIVLDCIVKAISPSDALTAQLLLVEKADAVYDAESTMDNPAYSPQLTTSLGDSTTPPGEVRSLEIASNSWKFNGSGYDYYIGLDWGVPTTGGAYEAFEVYVDDGSGYNLYDVTRNSDDIVNILITELGLVHNFKVLAVSANGSKLDLGSVGFVSATPVAKTTRPGDVLDLYINITNEVLQLNWIAPTDIDIKEYLIRYSPVPTGTWNSSIPLMKTGNSNTTTATQARTGTYLIKAIDWNGNESGNAAEAITSIPNLFNLNIVETTSDFPSLLGVGDQVQVLAGSLIIQNKVVGGVSTNEYYSEAFYYYNNFLDLGDIYSVRLQSLIQAEGYTLDDLMSNWTSLDNVISLSNSKFSEWDVETQVRATNTLNVMSEWPSLNVIDPISVGNQDNFTPWRVFTMGDFTGRIFQFRLRLISNKASVSPRVFDGVIKSDMPDRTDIYNNLSSSATIPYVVTYSTPFKGPGTTPNVQITQDAAQAGDRFVLSNKTLSSFEIVFYDGTSAQVVRQFDCAVKGFGHKSANSI